MRQITVDIPDSIDLELAAKETQFSLAKHYFGLKGPSELEMLGFTVIAAAIRDGLIKLPAKNKKRRKKG